ncbi:hypothetical protein ACQSD2_09970, partial [Streptococcus infantarius]
IQETTTFFQTHPGLLTLAVDNDEAGRGFCQKLSEKGLPIETDLPPLQELKTKADWNDVVKGQSNLSLRDMIQSAKLQVIRSNPPPRKNTALEL